MLPLRALRNAPLRAASKAPLASTRGYATTVADQAPEISPSLFDKKVEMSVPEKGRGYYVNESYRKIEDNLKVIRQR